MGVCSPSHHRGSKVSYIWVYVRPPTTGAQKCRTYGCMFALPPPRTYGCMFALPPQGLKSVVQWVYVRPPTTVSYIWVYVRPPTTGGVCSQKCRTYGCMFALPPQGLKSVVHMGVCSPSHHRGSKVSYIWVYVRPPTTGAQKCRTYGCMFALPPEEHTDKLKYITQQQQLHHT